MSIFARSTASEPTRPARRAERSPRGLGAAAALAFAVGALGIAAATLALPAPAHANGDHAHHGNAAGAAALTEGEVRKVDEQAGKITLRHGEIRNLEMPAMTMVFQVRDRTLLAGLKVGEQIRFRAENPGGTLTVTEIRRGK